MGSRFGEDIYGADAYGESGEGPFRLDFNRLTGELTFIELIDGEWTPRGVVNVAGLLGGPTGPTGPAGPTGAQGPTGLQGAQGPRGEEGAPCPNENADLLDGKHASEFDGSEEVWHTVGASGEPSFQNGWAHNLGQLVRFRRINGIVYLTGRAAGDTQSYIIFTLPAGYRPAQTSDILCGQGYGAEATVIRIDPDGDVSIQTGNTIAMFSGVCFPTS